MSRDTMAESRWGIILSTSFTELEKLQWADIGKKSKGREAKDSASRRNPKYGRE